jgi:hypothetical protein
VVTCVCVCRGIGFLLIAPSNVVCACVRLHCVCCHQSRSREKARRMRQIASAGGSGVEARERLRRWGRSGTLMMSMG